MWLNSCWQVGRLQIAASLGRAVIFAALCVPALSSCASPRPSFNISNFVSGMHQEEAPLQYFDWVSSIPPREQLVEKIRVRTRFESTGDMVEGVQLALVTGIIEPVAREELLHVVDILNEILLRYRDGPQQQGSIVAEQTNLPVPLTGTITEEYAQFAALWRTALLQRVTVMTISDEHSQQRVELEKLNRQLLENNLRLQEENDLLRKENPLLREENKSLLLQIEALKAIEQQMNRREQQQEFP
jgi:hypothetical protein